MNQDLMWRIGPPKIKATPEEWRFCVNTQNGRTYYNVECHAHGGSKDPQLGDTVRYAMTPEQQALMLNEGLLPLIALFLKEQKLKAKPAERPWEHDAALKAKMIERLARIITGSDQEGERNNARTLYRKLTGKEFTP